MFIRSLFILAAALSLGGCVAVWGHGYHVDFANSSSITINSDPMFDNTGDLQKIAQQHCDKYGKDAVPKTSEMDLWGLRDTSFVCVKRQSATANVASGSVQNSSGNTSSN